MCPGVEDGKYRLVAVQGPNCGRGGNQRQDAGLLSAGDFELPSNLEETPLKLAKQLNSRASSMLRENEKTSSTEKGGLYFIVLIVQYFIVLLSVQDCELF